MLIWRRSSAFAQSPHHQRLLDHHIFFLICMRMAIVDTLTCGCMPNKTFASVTTLQKHQKSMRHMCWALKLECRSCKLENMRLHQRVSQLSAQMKVAASQDWKCVLCNDSLPHDFKLCPDSISAYCAYHDQPYSAFESKDFVPRPYVGSN